MSTRCNVLIAKESKKDPKELDFNNVIWIYHHCDGYPKYVGASLRRMAKKFGKISPEEWRERLLNNKEDFGYVDTNDWHEDIDYVYVIFPETSTVKCYKVQPFGFSKTEDLFIDEVAF